MPNFHRIHNTVTQDADPLQRLLDIRKPAVTDIRELLAHREMFPSKCKAASPPQRPPRQEIPLVGWLTEKEVASLLGCSLSLLRQNRFYRKGIPFSKMGGGRAVRYAAEDVKSFMAARRIVPE
jgi:AraC-like DNA-binding protein